MATMSVRRKFDAISTICPGPTLAATISVATGVVQPKPMAMRMPTLFGRRRGQDDMANDPAVAHAHRTRAFVCSCEALRIPAPGGAKQLRKISSSLGNSSMPIQMMIRGR